MRSSIWAFSSINVVAAAVPTATASVAAVATAVVAVATAVVAVAVATTAVVAAVATSSATGRVLANKVNTADNASQS